MASETNAATARPTRIVRTFHRITADLLVGVARTPRTTRKEDRRSARHPKKGDVCRLCERVSVGGGRQLQVATRGEPDVDVGQLARFVAPRVLDQPGFVDEERRPLRRRPSDRGTRRDPESMNRLAVPVREQPEVEVERLRPGDVSPRGVARDADGLHAERFELRSPVTQELEFVRSGGGPVEQVEDEQLRPVVDQVEHRQRLVRPKEDGCVGDAVTGAEHRSESSDNTTGLATSKRGRTSSWRGNSAPIATACTFWPRRKIHWFAVGQSTSSVVASGDQTMSPKMPGPAKSKRLRPGWSTSTSRSSVRTGERATTARLCVPGLNAVAVRRLPSEEIVRHHAALPVENEHPMGRPHREQAAVGRPLQARSGGRRPGGATRQGRRRRAARSCCCPRRR